MATGVILADAKPDWRRSNRWSFRRSEISGFLEQVRQAALPSLPKVPTVPLNYALRYWRVTAAELAALLRSVKQGEIPFMLGDQGLLRDITFGEVILRDWLEHHRKSTAKWVSVTAAADLLQLKDQVVYELVSRNVLIADLTPGNGNMQKRISLSSLECFQGEYVALAELARQQKTSANSLMARLDAQPVTGPKIDGGRQYFYRRDDLQGDIISGIITDFTI